MFKLIDLYIARTLFSSIAVTLSTYWFKRINQIC